MGSSGSSERKNSDHREGDATARGGGGSGQAVKLNVYEPRESKRYQNIPAFSIYHSGLEVHGTEYVFGGGGAGLSTGVFTQRPKYMPATAPWKYKESLELGRTRYSRQEVNRIVREMKRTWRNSDYDITGRNCNHFTDALSKALGCRSVPGWLNRAARVGNAVRSVVGGSKNDPKNNGNDKNSALADDGKLAEIKEASIMADIDIGKTGCLNAHTAHSLKALLDVKQPGFLQSDSDPQLLIVLPFKSAVKARGLVITGGEGESCPKTVKVFVNMPNLDFEEAEDTPPVAQFEISKAEKTQSFRLPAAKFNMVRWITIFVEDNHGADFTIIKFIDFTGRK
ncbi:hypothetical protein AAMO2058_000513900 [Amorphochlora amoebiformis]